MVERKRTTWEKSLLRRHAAPKKNETTSSTHQTKQTKVKRGDPISSIISVIRPARLILSLFSLTCFLSFLKSIQQNTFLFSAQTYLFLLLYIFSLTIDGMFLWVTGSYNIWLCCSSVDPSGEYVWMRRISGWGSALSCWRGTPSHPFP